MFYDQFIKLCDERGEKPTPVAKKLGCSSSNVALWKKGSVPRTPVLSKIADYFGVTTQYLLFGDTDDPSIKKDTTVFGDVSELSDLQREAWNMLLKMDDDTLRAFITLARVKLQE